LRTTTALAAAALLSGAAYADTWTAAYDNTILSTYADGRVVKVFVNADHTYSIALPDGNKLTGTWADANADGKSCFTLTDPPPKPGDKPVCLPAKEYKLGDSFEGEDPTGKFTGVFQAGR